MLKKIVLALLLVLMGSYTAYGQIVLSGNVTAATCKGSANGSIGLGISGGEMPYQYNWSTGASTKD